MEPGMTKEEQLSIYLKMGNSESDREIVRILQSIVDGDILSNGDKQTIMQYVRKMNLKTVENSKPDKIDSFCNLAEDYCSYIGNNEISIDTVEKLMELLMKLYIAAMDLPNLEPNTIEEPLSAEDNNFKIQINEQIEPFYWEVFDPYILEEPVCGHLEDDLSGIAEDLLCGIKEYEAGRYCNAVFEWRLGLYSHWGNHVVNALRALHSIRAREY